MIVVDEGGRCLDDGNGRLGTRDRAVDWSRIVDGLSMEMERECLKSTRSSLGGQLSLFIVG